MGAPSLDGRPPARTSLCSGAALRRLAGAAELVLPLKGRRAAWACSGAPSRTRAPTWSPPAATPSPCWRSTAARWAPRCTFRV